MAVWLPFATVMLSCLDIDSRIMICLTLALLAATSATFLKKTASDLAFDTYIENLEAQLAELQGEKGDILANQEVEAADMDQLIEQQQNDLTQSINELHAECTAEEQEMTDQTNQIIEEEVSLLNDQYADDAEELANIDQLILEIEGNLDQAYYTQKTEAEADLQEDQTELAEDQQTLDSLDGKLQTLDETRAQWSAQEESGKAATLQYEIADESVSSEEVTSTVLQVSNGAETETVEIEDEETYQESTEETVTLSE